MEELISLFKMMRRIIPTGAMVSRSYVLNAIGYRFIDLTEEVLETDARHSLFSYSEMPSAKCPSCIVRLVDVRFQLCSPIRLSPHPDISPPCCSFLVISSRWD
jgi:hypothetical protein